MKLTIFRGTNEVGGNCFELSSGNDRIIFDVGLPLSSMEEKKDISEYKLDIKGLYSEESASVKAVFISHAHPDHYGMLELVNSDIPIYMSKVSKNILLNIAPLISDFDPSSLNIIELEDYVSIKIGDFDITPYPVDHSISGALAFEIKSEEKNVIYSGDIRFHGRRSFINDKLVNQASKTDYMILEGSTLSRNEKGISEQDVEQLMSDAFSDDKFLIISFSAQNLDRFISVYKACLKNKKTLVIDPYTAFLLENFQLLSENIPQFNWNNIRVYFAQNSITTKLAEDKTLYRYKSKKITIEEILSNPYNFVIKDNYKITTQLLGRIDVGNLQIIYSMWKGYLEKPSIWDNYKDRIVHIHASGHGSVAGLKDFVQKINPKTLIPIHTMCKNEYEDIFERNILIVEDGEEMEL